MFEWIDKYHTDKTVRELRQRGLNEISDICKEVEFIHNKVRDEFGFIQRYKWRRDSQLEYDCLQEHNCHGGITNQLEAWNTVYERYRT